MVPSVAIKGVRLESCKCRNETMLTVNFEVDEDKTRYTTAYESFKEYSRDAEAMFMKNRIDPYLDAVWRRNMSIKFVLTGSRSGYAQDIHVF